MHPQISWALRKDQGRKGKEHRQGGSPGHCFVRQQKYILASPPKWIKLGFFPPIIGILHFSGYLQHGFRTVLALTSGGCLATATAKRCRGWCNAARRAAKTTQTGGSEWQNCWCFFVTFLGWLSNPFQWLSDLQLGDEKVTLNHLVVGVFFVIKIDRWISRFYPSH